jgi:hypothetical protein
VRVVENRPFSDRELLFAVETDVEDSGRNTLRFESASFGILPGAGAGRLTYFVMRLLSQWTHSTPSGQRIDSRKSLQASGVANCLATSIRFVCGL